MSSPHVLLINLQQRKGAGRLRCKGSGYGALGATTPRAGIKGTL